MVVQARAARCQVLGGASLLQVLPGQSKDPMHQIAKLVGQVALQLL